MSFIKRKRSVFSLYSYSCYLVFELQDCILASQANASVISVLRTLEAWKQNSSTFFRTTFPMSPCCMCLEHGGAQCLFSSPFFSLWPIEMCYTIMGTIEVRKGSWKLPLFIWILFCLMNVISALSVFLWLFIIFMWVSLCELECVCVCRLSWLL